MFDYNQLPFVDSFIDENFNWLNGFPNWISNEPEPDFTKKLFQLTKEANSKGLKLPASFTRFLSTEDLFTKIRSNTDCYFELGDEIELVDTENGWHVLHFMSDSQYCIFWYLALNQEGNTCVIASHNLYGHTASGSELFRNYPDEIGYLCAEDFTEFIYRFWIENEIWYKVIHKKTDLNNMEKAYVNAILKNRNI